MVKASINQQTYTSGRPAPNSIRLRSIIRALQRCFLRQDICMSCMLRRKYAISPGVRPVAF